MKHVKLFFAVFAMLALGVGNAWAETATFSTSVYDGQGGASGSGGSATATIEAVTISSTKAYYTSAHIREYSGGEITISSSNKISKIVFTSTANKGSNNGPDKITLKSGSSGTYSTTNNSKDGTWTGETTSITFSCSAQFRWTQIVVTYEAASTPETPVASLTATPTTIDFGTVYEGATVADKTVAVNFANLTGNVTYSGLSTPFTATGAISATGDKITISADASTIGEYSQTLTVASTADSKTAEVTVKMNVVEKPAPTGTFTLHTGELIEGDYVIYYSGKAMKAEVASNRLQYVEVTPSNNEIVDPVAAAVWHIAPSGTNWTIYNNNEGYAAGTGTKSQAGLVANLTGDNANKAAWTVTASGNAYEFVNVWNQGESVNANLRNNGTYGFACYATSTGGALSLYRKAGTKYNVTVSSTTNGSVTADPTSAEAGATIALTVTPAAGYILDALTVTDASSNTIEVADNKFTMPASDVTVTATFKLNEKPAATLTLSMNGETEDITGYKQDDKVTLPETIDNDCIKAFVGWSANPACSTEPEYAPGDEYTLTATTQTLYAVYATVNGGAETKAANTLSSNGWENESKHTSLQIDANVKAEVIGGSNSGKYYENGTNWRLYQNENATITISTTVGELKSVKFTFTNSNTGTFLYGSTILTSGNAIEVSDTSAIFTVGNSGTALNGQIRISEIEVVYTGDVSYSNYSTTCSAALTAPTFSVVEGEYVEAQSITLSAEEGTIYYTLDGTTPDAESTEYIEPIVLDECGTTTIKAIAISGENSSPVAAATYTIQLPIPANDAENPYTAEEAIEVYNGGCYDDQDVYVMGVVETAQFYNSNTYTITLEGGFQFYKFYEDAGKTEFTENYIQPGDTLVACGKLDKHNSNYQLAEGCYLVERKPYSAPKVDISNTEETAYTVEKAIELIDDITSDLTKLVYVKGTVSEIVTEYDAEYGNITYNISSDGSTSSPQFQLYRGKSYNGDKFTSADDVKVGDKVVVYGEMTKYGSTYEMLANNQLVALEREGTTTGVDNVETTVAAKKAIINGQLVIVKDGVKFNALGQVIK